jgi:hypothetical protein
MLRLQLLCDQRVSSPSYESRWKLEFWFWEGEIC